MRTTAAQKRWLNLCEIAKGATEEAEKLRKKLAKTCKHPNDLRVAWMESYYQLGRVTLGVKCSICKRHAFGTTPGTDQWLPADEARDAIAVQCLHPEAWQRDHRWHHGYGKYVNGLECGVCMARKSFKSQGYWTPMSEWSQWKGVRDDD